MLERLEPLHQISGVAERLLSAEMLVALPQEVDAAEDDVDRGGVERPLAGTHPHEVAFEVMGQRRDAVEPQQRRRSLDRVQQPERLIEMPGLRRRRLE